MRDSLSPRAQVLGLVALKDVAHEVLAYKTMGCDLLFIVFRVLRTPSPFGKVTDQPGGGSRPEPAAASQRKT